MLLSFLISTCGGVKMSKLRRLRKYLIWAFFAGIVGIIGMLWYQLEHSIPDKLNIVAQEEEHFSFEIPFEVKMLSDSQEVVVGNGSNIPSNQINLKLDESFSLYAKEEGTYQIGLQLFGTVLLKEIEVNVVQPQYATPCGTPVGIYLEANGIMVVGTGAFRGMDGSEVNPAEGILQSGDYVESIDGIPLESKEDLVSILNEVGSRTISLQIRREEQLITVSMKPKKADDGTYKLGIWIRDDTQGIGTLTYIDENGNYGALGHGISDADTGEVLEIGGGTLYETQIMGIEKGEAGDPGIMAGIIYYGPGTQLGTIGQNTDVGIFGSANERLIEQAESVPMEIGYRQDVKKGQAWIRSSVSGEVKDYEIEIIKVDYNPIQKNKGLVIKVVDPELLELTGGIVQGMSGSPVLQNGKLIGAVTHVFVNDPTRGYGIFIENMLETAESIE